MSQIELELNGLNCANCAMKIEKFSGELEGVKEARLDFVTKKLRIKIYDNVVPENVTTEIKKIVKRLEPHVKVIEKNKIEKPHIKSNNYHEEHDHCQCGEDHGHNHAHSHQHTDDHNHTHEHGVFDKVMMLKIMASGVLFVLPIIFKLQEITEIILYTLAYLVIGYDILIRAFKNIMAGMVFDENFLMAIATICAFAIGEYPEAIAVMLFYQVGELFQGMAVNQSRKSIASLLDIRPDVANVERNGDLIMVDPNEVALGEVIIVKPGEKVPLDGVIIEGESSLDTSNITGESLPRNVVKGDHVLSGVVNNQGLLKIKVEKEFGESTVSKILDLVENASGKKAETEKFITKFARYYTPIVVIISLVIAILPPILLSESFSQWIYRACIFLVISCPCALVISIPLGFFGGIGGASKVGVLIKGGNYLEVLNDVDTVVFDKTGTITKGKFTVDKVIAYEDYSEEEILELGAYAESYSNHPIGKSILASYNKEIKKEFISEYKEIPAKGIEANINNMDIICGNKNLFLDRNINLNEIEEIGTIVYIGKDNKHIGTIIVADQLKDNVIKHIQKLKKSGVKRTIMLSGDNQETAEIVAKTIGLDQVYGNLLPQDKVSLLEEIMSQTKGKVAFIGDGVNDAPVLARADVGIAMGGLGSDAAIEASDIVIMTDEIGKVATGIKIARKTKKIVVQNIILALGVKLVVLVLGTFGLSTMWEAVFADVGVSILAILNSMRVLKIEE